MRPTIDHDRIASTAREAAAILGRHPVLVAAGAQACYEPFDDSIFVYIRDQEWHFGTVNEEWDADIMSADQSREIGCCSTGIPRESADGAGLADAILAALTAGVGVEIWSDRR
jgi:hypothetical protein